MAAETIKANMGELKVGKEGDVLSAFGVGSCIIIACYDKLRPIAVMLHGILPEKPDSKPDTNENKYLNTGIENMVKMLLKEGVALKDMEAKIFGGAKMFDIKSESEAIGERNIKQAKGSLALKGIIIKAEDIGSNYGRTIEFNVSSKAAVVKSFSAGTKNL